MATQLHIERLNCATAARNLDDLVEFAAQVNGAPHWPRAVWETAIAALDESTPLAGRILLTARQQEQLAGLLLCSYAAGEAELESIAVHEARQRRGTGRLLLNAAAGILRGLGTGVMHLEVHAGNQNALGFYRTLGFEERGRRIAYYSQPPGDAVLMSLCLPLSPPSFERQSA
jgi:ribosomal protein S18 acetylase RimI-like enzyme